MQFAHRQIASQSCGKGSNFKCVHRSLWYRIFRIFYAFISWDVISIAFTCLCSIVIGRYSDYISMYNEDGLVQKVVDVLNSREMAHIVTICCLTLSRG